MYVGDEELRVYFADKSTHFHSPLGICQALILLDHVGGISVKRDLDGFDWIVSEFCYCIEITRYPALGVGMVFCQEAPRDFDFDL